MKFKALPLFLWAFACVSLFLYPEELPIPTYNNSLIISIEHSVLDTAEVDYILNNFNFGLYAWPAFSRTTITVDLGWHQNLNRASEGIQETKAAINTMIEAARAKKVRLHIVLSSGLARGLSVYHEAKQEDIRNCEWYNDNKIAADNQIVQGNAMNSTVFGTFSRYARKLRANLEAKAQVFLAFLKQKIDENPDVFIAISGWSDAEFNPFRADQSKSHQDVFADYSPFIILEFVDWIRHTGLYDSTNGKYAGEGFSQGGDKYQGIAGLATFNLDFGTSFRTWDLKYFNWNLNDDYDINPEDTTNNDPHRIPFSSYSHGNMLPTSGANYIADGFDPPRTMKPGNIFWDLWNLFRETVIHHFVKDMAKWASEAGIPANMWYSHQSNKNSSYPSSASPLWTANVLPYGSPGAKICDIKHPTWFDHTTLFSLEEMAAMHSNWAILEYDPETYPVGLDVPESSVELLHQELMKIYSHSPHVINIYRWWDDNKEHRFKGMNKERALAKFINRVRDKARKTDLNFVFDPPQVFGFSGRYIGTAKNSLRRSTQSKNMLITIDRNIWKGQPWEWKDWGDFAFFEVYRGNTPDFPGDPAHLIGTTKNYTFEDWTTTPGRNYTYKIRAVNTKGKAGPFSDEKRLPAFCLILTAGPGGTTDPPPGIYNYSSGTKVLLTALPAQGYIFSNLSGDQISTTNPVSLIMTSDKEIKANFLEFTVLPPLNLTGDKYQNRSLLQIEYVIVLKWESNPLNQDIFRYNVYQLDGGKYELLAELNANTFSFTRRRVNDNKQYTFALTAINRDLEESVPVFIVFELKEKKQ